MKELLKGTAVFALLLAAIPLLTFLKGEREPVEGELIYRGYSINDIVENTSEKGR